MPARVKLVASGLCIALAIVLVSCSDSADEALGPPIPTLADAVDQALDTPDAVFRHIQPMAGCANCVEWSCASGICGYDTAVGGPCCTDCDFSQPAVPPPSCEGGGGEPGGECGPEDPWSCDIPGPGTGYCPPECSCCY